MGGCKARRGIEKIAWDLHVRPWIGEGGGPWEGQPEVILATFLRRMFLVRVRYTSGVIQIGLVVLIKTQHRAYEQVSCADATFAGCDTSQHFCNHH
jgi:hypothetical protein